MLLGFDVALMALMVLRPMVTGLNLVCLHNLQAMMTTTLTLGFVCLGLASETTTK